MEHFHIQSSIPEFLNSISQEEYRLRVEYVKTQWKRPKLTDYYLMQVAVEVARKFANHPERISLEDKKLVVEEKKQLTKEERSKLLKQRTLQALGIQPHE